MLFKINPTVHHQHALKDLSFRVTKEVSLRDTEELFFLSGTININSY